MSHYSINIVKIENVNREVLLNSLRKLCKSYGFREVNSIRDYYGNRLYVGRDLDFAFVGKSFWRGIGVKVTRDGFKVVGDFYGTGMREEEITDMIRNRYVADSVSMALNELGFMNIEEHTEEETIILEASGW